MVATNMRVDWRHGAAVADASDAVKLAPGAADIAVLANHGLAASGNPEEAVVLSEKAMTFSPKFPALSETLTGCQGRTQQAIAVFQASPKTPDVLPIS
jgi:uncharacterized membrane-anchored protein